MDHKSLRLLTFNVRSLVDLSRETIQIFCFYSRMSFQNFICDGTSISVAILIKDSIEYNRINSNDIGFNCSLIKISLDQSNLRCPQTYTSYKQTNWIEFRSDMDAISNLLLPPANRNLENMKLTRLYQNLIPYFLLFSCTFSETGNQRKSASSLW